MKHSATIPAVNSESPAHKAAQRDIFHTLPAELRVQILLELPAFDIARCQRVCRWFRILILRTQVLQHKIQLYLCGVVERPTQRSLTMRTADLLRWRKHWRRGLWAEESSERAYFSLRRNLVCGSVLAWNLRFLQPDIEFRRFPSVVRGGVEAKSWKLENIPRSKVFACDYDQDLLVLVEDVHVDTGIMKLHILSCTTDQPHCSARKPTIEVALDRAFELDLWDFSICVTGDHVGVSANHEYEPGPEYQYEVWVLDWKLGRTLLNVHGHGGLNTESDPIPFDCAFLDGQHVLIVTGGTNPIPCVAAFDSTNFSPGRHLLADALHKHAVLMLNLPNTAPGTSGLLDTTIWSCPRLPHVIAQTVHADDTAWFRWADGSPAVIVQVNLFDRKNRHRKFSIVIPGRAITARLSAQANGRAPQGPVPWSDWALDVFMHEVPLYGGPPSVCGSRYLRECTSLRLDENGKNVHERVAVVYHVDSRAALPQENDFDNAYEKEDDGCDSDTAYEEGDDSDSHDEGLPEVYRFVGQFGNAPLDPNGGNAWPRYTWTNVDLREERENAYLFEDGIVVLGKPITEGMMRIYTI